MGLTLTGTAGTVPIRHRLDRGFRRATRTVAHDVLDDAYPVVAVALASSRSGSLRLLLDAADVDAADDLVASGGVLELVDDVDPTRSLRFVVLDGAELGDDLVLRLPYRELRP